MTSVIASADADWRRQMVDRLKDEEALVILGEWDGEGDPVPCGARIQDNRLKAHGGPGVIIKVGADPDVPFDLPWPFDDDLLAQHLEKVRAALSKHGLVHNPEFLRAAYERLIELSSDSIEIVDTNVRLLYVNPAFENITGYQLPEALGRTTGELFRTGARDPSFYREIMHCLRRGEVWRGQLIARRADKTLSYQESILAPVSDSQGETLGFVALKRDLERDNLLKHALARQDSKHAALFQEVADAFLLHDENGYLLDHNSRAVRMFNLEVRPQQGQPSLLECVHPSDRIKLANHWKQLKKDDSIEIDALLNNDPSGDKRIVSFRSVRVMVAGEDLLLSIARDITLRVALEQQKQELSQAQQHIKGLTQTLQEERQQEKSARIASLSVLAGSLAHDLNNALSVITGNLDFLQHASDAQERQEVLDDIKHGITSAQDITRRLASFSSGSAVVLSPLHLQPWLAELARVFRSGQRATVDLKLATAPLWCQADEPQLTQVVINLLMNAYQAAGKHKTITVSLFTETPQPDTPLLHIRVEDEGPGIPQELINRIFEPFVTTKPGGSGLGLASSQRIINEHGGTLSAFNKSTGGACFKVTLPAIKSSERSHSFSHKTRDDDPQNLSLHGLSVVVLDDEPNVLSLLGRLLSNRGASVELFRTGEQLIEWAKDQQQSDKSIAQHIFVLDLLIEDSINGIETLHQLRLLDDVVAIACSGYSPDPTIDDYHTVGFHAYIKKPFQPLQLIQAIKEASYNLTANTSGE